MIHTATITKSNQIGIPKAIMDSAHLQKGDKIQVVDMQDGRIMLVRKNSNIKLGLNLPKANKPISTEDIKQALQNRDSEHAATILGNK